MSEQVAKASRLYAALAPAYDDETKFITGIRKRAIEALRLQPGETVLDAGCGTGWCLPMLSSGVGGPGRVTGPGTFSMVIAQLAHIGEISCRRWLDPALSAEQLHNAGRVDEFLTQPITRRIIDEFVAVLSG